MDDLKGVVEDELNGSFYLEEHEQKVKIKSGCRWGKQLSDSIIHSVIPKPEATVELEEKIVLESLDPNIKSKTIKKFFISFMVRIENIGLAFTWLSFYFFVNLAIALAAVHWQIAQ